MDSTYTRVRTVRYPRRSQDADFPRDASAAELAVAGDDAPRPVTMTTRRRRVAAIVATVAQLGRTGTAMNPRDCSSSPGRRRATGREDAAVAWSNVPGG